MTKIFALIFFFSITFLSAQSQSVYELSFTFPNNTGSINYKACFIDNNNDSAKLRLKFAAPVGRDSILADFDVVAQYVDNNSNCFNGDRIYYKLQKPKYIESKDPGVKLPGFFCFVKDNATGFFEPYGVTNSLTDCKGQVVKFSDIAVKQQKDLTKAFVLTYFKDYDVFYRNIFVTNNSKALTTSDRNVKLFLLFVANTTDKEIGTADRKNMTDAITFFRNVKEFLGINTFVFDTITGRRLNKTNVENAINTFYTPGPNDIVVFYFSGHGFRKEKDGRPAPYIDLRDE